MPTITNVGHQLLPKEDRSSKAYIMPAFARGEDGPLRTGKIEKVSYVMIRTGAAPPPHCTNKSSVKLVQNYTRQSTDNLF